MNITLALLATALLAVMPLAAQPTLAYEPVEGWPQLPEEIKMGAGMSASVDGDGNTWLYNRGSHSMVLLDPSGKLLKAWKDGTVLLHSKSAHGMRVAPDGGLWLVGREAQTVWKYSPEGHVLVTIGSFGNMAGDNDSPYAFDRPAGVAVDSKGDVYVADGYKNSRVVKYNSEGKYIMHWGSPGAGKGEFKLVHDVTIDAQDFIYVADRGNERVQVFTSNGGFVAEWNGIGVPWGLVYDKWRNVIWMCDGDNGKISKLNLDGEVLGVFGENGQGPGQFDQVHHLTVDEEGSIYAAETKNSRIQKFVLKD